MDNFRNECKIVKTKNLSPLEHVYSMSYMSLSDIYMSSSIPTSSFSRLAICRSFLSLFTSWEAWLFCIHVTIYPACCHIFTSSFSRLAICRSFLSLFTSWEAWLFCIHVTICPTCRHIITSSFSRLAICRSFLSLFTSWEAWLFCILAFVDSVLNVSAAYKSFHNILF